MKNQPITSRVKKSPLKQTTDPKKIKGTGAGEQGQLQEFSVSGTPGSKETVPATRKVEKQATTPEEIKRWEDAMAKNPNLEAERGYVSTEKVTPGKVDVEITEPKTQAREGTKSDVATVYEQRKYGAGGRMEKVAQRQERKAGKQDMRLLDKAKKRGLVSGEDYTAQMKTAKEKRYGQGEVAKEARKQMSSKEQAQIQREQITQKKIPGKSIYTNNFEVPTAAQRGGDPIMAPKGTKSTASQIDEATKAITGGSGQVLQKKDLFKPKDFGDSVKSSGINMMKSASPFKMKGYGKKKC